MIWLLIATYCVGFVVCVYPFARGVLNDFIGGGLYGSKPDSFDYAASSCFGTILAAVWPAILVGYAVYRLSRRIWEGRPEVDQPERERIS